MVIPMASRWRLAQGLAAAMLAALCVFARPILAAEEPASEPGSTSGMLGGLETRSEEVANQTRQSLQNQDLAVGLTSWTYQFQEKMDKHDNTAAFIGYGLSPWISLTGAPHLFREGGRTGWAYNVMYNSAKFDMFDPENYHSPVDDKRPDKTTGRLDAQYLFATPTLILLAGPSRWRDIVRFRIDLGLGVAVTRFTGKIVVHGNFGGDASHTFDDAYRGNGALRYGLVATAKPRAILFNHAVVELAYNQALPQLVSSGRGSYSFEGIQVNVGAFFQF